MTSTGTPVPVPHRRLVVGFDGSESSVSAIEWAASEAESRAASVLIVSSYAMEPVVDFGAGASGSGVDMSEVTAACQDRLRVTAAKVFADHRDVEHDIEVSRASPAIALLREAEDADLVIVGSSGAGSITRFLLGSVTEQLVARAPCSVFVVKPQGYPYLRD